MVEYIFFTPLVTNLMCLADALSKTTLFSGRSLGAYTIKICEYPFDSLSNNDSTVN